MIKLTRICIDHQVSRDKLEKEYKKGFGIDAVLSYQDRGCFECNGFDSDCPHYFSQVEAYVVSLNSITEEEQ